MSNTPGLIGLLHQKLGYLGQRQSVLAENVANANTPGYKPKDLAPFSFAQAMQDAQSRSTMNPASLRVTNPGHIGGVGAGSGTNFAVKKMKTTEILPSGNAVNLEQQMSEVSQTAVEYNAYTGLLGRVRSWMKMALGRQS